MEKMIYTTEYAAILNRLRSHRLDAGLTQAELARKLGVPRLFVCRCERGARRIDVAEFMAFCRALDLDPKALIGDVEQQRVHVSPPHPPKFARIPPPDQQPFQPC